MAIHRKIMEGHLGRELRSDEHIHHINGDHYDNRIENLQIVSPSEHRKLHRKYRGGETRLCTKIDLKKKALFKLVALMNGSTMQSLVEAWIDAYLEGTSDKVEIIKM